MKRKLQQVLNFINWFTSYINMGLYPYIRTIDTAEYADYYYQGADDIYILCATLDKHEGWYVIDWRLPPVPGDDSGRGCYYVNGRFVMPGDFTYPSLVARDTNVLYDDISF